MAAPTSSARPQAADRSIGASIGRGIQAAGNQIRDDFRHGMDKDYGTPASRAAFDARTQASRERAMQDEMRRDGGGSNRMPMASEPTPGELGPRADSPAMRYRRMMAGRAPMPQQATPQPMQQPTMPGGKGANALTMGPQAPEVTSEMRQAALQQFESQQGAGPMPMQMMSPGATSPAFQYAAQNYDTLGGAQRLAPRPMEMMSVAERQQVNAMAEQQAQAEFEQMRDLFQRGGAGKGAGRTMPTNAGPNVPQLPVGGIMSLMGRGR